MARGEIDSELKVPCPWRAKADCPWLWAPHLKGLEAITFGCESDKSLMNPVRHLLRY